MVRRGWWENCSARLLRQQLGKLSLTGSEHSPQVRATKATAVAAPGFPYHVFEGPSVLPRQGEKLGEGHLAADAGGDEDAGHESIVWSLESGVWSIKSLIADLP